MREYKFRVWSQAEKTWSNTSMLEVWDNSGILKPFAFLGHPIENYIIQQATGLKDKNDKDIFEGDILKIINKGGLLIFSTGIYWAQVKWDENDFQFNLNLLRYEGGKNAQYSTNLNGESIREYEVVGNIFENPELIKS